MLRNKITLHDVSRFAKVSTATVSYVINNTHPVSEKTRNTVLEAIKELGYVPDARARSLRNSRVQTISVFFPYGNESTHASRYFRDILASICATSGSRGYKVLIHYVSRGTAQKKQIVEICRSRSAGGIIFVGLGPDEIDFMHQTVQDFPTILLGSCDERFSYVDVDNQKGMLQAVKTMVDRGHQRITFINSVRVDSHHLQRESAYHKAMFDLGFQDNIQKFNLPVKPDNDDVLVQMLKQRPTGIIAFDDFRAFQVLSFLNKQGIRVPQDVGVVGFDNEDLGLHTAPKLTTMEIPFFDMGSLAAKKLIEKMEGDSTDIFQYKFDMRAIIRESC